MKCAACGYDSNPTLDTTHGSNAKEYVDFKFAQAESSRVGKFKQLGNVSILVDSVGSDVESRTMLYACPRCKTVRIA